MLEGDKIVRHGKRAAVARGEPAQEVVLESDEFIDEYDEVRVGWKKKDAVEQEIPARPARTELLPDEYVDGGRVKVRSPRQPLPPGAKTELTLDEYIDETGVVRSNRPIRKKLEARQKEKVDVSVKVKPKRVARRKPKARRDRRHMEPDEYIHVDVPQRFSGGGVFVRMGGWRIAHTH